ncbi:hypothetical protein V6154_26665, partial [Klebsiella pneumoniae]
MIKEQIFERLLWRFWRYNGTSKPIALNPRFRYVGLGLVRGLKNKCMRAETGAELTKGVVENDAAWLCDRSVRRWRVTPDHPLAGEW